MTATGQPVKNKDDLLVLDRIMQENKGLQIKYGSILWSPFDLCHSGKFTLYFVIPLPSRWNHVKGHSNVPGNEAADRLAVEGANMSSQW